MAKKRTRSNGEGTIYHNGKYWVGQVTIGQDPQSGKQKRKTIYGKTKREVSEKLVEIQSELNKGTFTDPTNATVKEWVDFWLENFKKNQVNETTFQNYEYLIKNHLIKPFGNLKLKNLNSFILQEYLNKLKTEGISTGYIKLLKITISSMFEQAVKLEVVTHNPCKKLVMPKEKIKKNVQALTKDEQNKFVEYCYEHDEFLYLFMLGTGVRIGEALGLMWDFIDFNNEIINIKNIAVEIKGAVKLQEYPKTATSIRSIPMSAKIKNILLELQKRNYESALVFPSSVNKIRSSSIIRNKLKRICTKINITSLSPHMLRHTFATRMLEAGVNIKVLSDILGHNNINITLDTYAHVLPDTKKENIMKIDEYI